MNISFKNLFHFQSTSQVKSPSFLKQIKQMAPSFMKSSSNADTQTGISAIMQISKEGIQKLSHAMTTQKEELKQQDIKIYESEKESLQKKRDELKSTLDSLKDRMNDIKADVTAIPTKETEEQLIEAEEQLRQLKEEQEKIFQLKEKMAQEIAAKAGKQEVDQQMRYGDLYMMKKSFEREKEDEEAAKEKETSSHSTSYTDSQQAIKDSFSNSSLTQDSFTTTPADTIGGLGNEITRIAFTTETRMDKTISKMYKDYHEMMDHVYSVMDDINIQLDDLYKICDDERYTDHQKEDAISDFAHNASMMLYGIAEERGIAQRIKDNADFVSRERRMGDNHMQLAARYSGNLDQLSEIVEKLDGMQDILNKLENEQDEEYKEAIERIDEEKGTDISEKDEEESPAPEDSELIYSNSKDELKDVTKNSEKKIFS